MEKKYSVKVEVYSNFKINKSNRKIIKSAFNDLNNKLQNNVETKNIKFDFNNIEEIINDALINEKLLDYIIANGELTLNIDKSNGEDILYKICDDRLSLLSINYNNDLDLVTNEEESIYNVDFIINNIKVID
jgi:hypothetical protein